MLEKLDVDEILRTNSNLDRKELEAGLSLSAQLHSQGLRRKEYGLAAPGEGRKVKSACSKGQRYQVQLTQT